MQPAHRVRKEEQQNQAEHIGDINGPAGCQRHQRKGHRQRKHERLPPRLLQISQNGCLDGDHDNQQKVVGIEAANK